MTKFLVGFTFLTVPFFGPPAQAADCNVLRQARVAIKIERLHWIQDQGNYKLQTDLICKTNGPVPVLAKMTDSCVYPVIGHCAGPIDGDQHDIKVSGVIIQDAAGKRFNVGYHLDRNTTEVKTGEAASAEISTPDVGLKKIDVSLQSKLDSPGPFSSSRDGLTVTASFEDADAP